MDKNTKILIPEISGEWTDRTRSGNTCIWNQALHGRPHSNGLPEVRLDAPEVGLYAERIDGTWYWVSGCAKCNGKGEKYSYVVCDKHNVCVRCSTHRSKLTETPWGHPDGFMCKPCGDVLAAIAKAEALTKFAEEGYDDHDFQHMDECKCPHCATKVHLESEDYGSGSKTMTCSTCNGAFSLEIEYTPSFTTTVIGERVTA